MSATFRAEPDFDGDHGAPHPRLALDAVATPESYEIRLAGELDLATRSRLVAALAGGRQASTVIDLGGVTFMDCSGYGSIVASRSIVEGDGRSLTLRGQSGQPARLLQLIARMESGHTAEH